METHPEIKDVKMIFSLIGIYSANQCVASLTNICRVLLYLSSTCRICHYFVCLMERQFDLTVKVQVLTNWYYKESRPSVYSINLHYEVLKICIG